MTEPDQPVWVEVDLGKIRRNVNRLKRHLAPGALLLAVVKANGYGHGDVQSAQAALRGGADWLGVARVEEAAALRTAGIDAPILMLSEPRPALVKRLVELDVVATVYTLEGAKALSEASMASRTTKVHLKIDTGMHRYGMDTTNLKRFFEMATGLGGLEIAGVWSHLSTAEDQTDPYAKKQIERFIEAVELLPARGEGLIKHIANSAGLLAYPEAHFDMARAGISIYGISPTQALAGQVELEPALEFKSVVGFLKALPAGEPISYGNTYFTASDTNIATIPCGYADGVSRKLAKGGEVLIGGKRHPIAGTVTMDHVMVDVGSAELSPGDEVVLIGKQDNDQITAHEVADRMETIAYEVVCGISSRVPRIYLDD